MIYDKTCLIIDGSSLLCRYYYKGAGFIKNADELNQLGADEQLAAYRQLLTCTEDGYFTDAIKAFLLHFSALITQYHFTNVVVCWDKDSKTTFRKQMYPAYKDGRKPASLPLKQQLANTRLILEQMGVAQGYGDLYEADDYAGSVAKEMSKDMDVVLLTSDQDYLQLVDNHVTVWLLTLENVISKHKRNHNLDKSSIINGKIVSYTPSTLDLIYKMTPTQIKDWKAIGGDHSDNIKGVEGISNETAQKLLQHFSDIDAIYEHIDKEDMSFIEKSWKVYLKISRPAHVVNLLKQQKKECYFCRELVTIKTDIDVKDIIKKSDISNIHPEKIQEYLEMLQLTDVKSHLEKIIA